MKYIPRTAEKYLKKAIGQMPVIAILGPRQSGKTTLAQHTLPDYQYVSLEQLDMREFALKDPRGFLKNYADNKVIIDEIQYAPDLFSYIQVDVDARQQPGQYVVTGSHNLLLHKGISQSLAGRATLLTLLPFSIEELKHNNLLSSPLDETLFMGFYPRIIDKSTTPYDWYQDYIKTYIEKDVRQLQNVQDLVLFQRFLRLCFGRIGQLLNISSLANDAGISVSTARGWLSILEASYLLFTLQPYHENFSKRLIKSPKLYAYDSGLACSLLGITSSDQIALHYLKGGLFESFVITDIIKQAYNMHKNPQVYFWRDNHGNEIDCIIDHRPPLALEIKAGQTISSDYFTGLSYWSEITKASEKNNYVIYGGDISQQRTAARVVSWKDLPISF